MRFRITFNRTGKQRLIPVDYQYFLSAWIYKVIGQADQDFSNFLHSEGYSSRGKQFKLFCYSPLNFGRPRLWKEKALFEIKSDQLFLHVSFRINEVAEKFIIGLFNQQQLYIGDRFNGLDLEVARVERLPEPVLMETMNYQAYSPVVVSHKEESRHAYAQYMSPVMDHYQAFLKENLISKYQSIPRVEPLPANFTFNLQVHGIPKSKLITMKPGTSQQSKVRGFVYDFTLACPAEMHQLVLDCGIGEKNSMGFGWVEPSEVEGD